MSIPGRHTQWQLQLIITERDLLQKQDVIAGMGNPEVLANLKECFDTVEEDLKDEDGFYYSMQGLIALAAIEPEQSLRARLGGPCGAITALCGAANLRFCATSLGRADGSGTPRRFTLSAVELLSIPSINLFYP